MDPQNRQSVLQGVNRPIVYHRNLDITREVLDRLNRTPRVSSQSRTADLAGDTAPLIAPLDSASGGSATRCDGAREPPSQAWMLPTLVPPLDMQNTIARPVTVDGFGFWSGRDVRLQFRPAPPETGIVFVRSDLKPVVRIPARVDCRQETPRRTTLCHRAARVEMVEHVMAALAGLRIDNCEVWVDAVEMPGVTVRACRSCRRLQSAGIVPQAAVRSRLVVTATTRVGDDEDWIEARPSADSACPCSTDLDFGTNHPIGRETLRQEITPACFVRQLAPARTFILKQEADWLRQQGFAQRVTPQDVLVFDDRGLIDNQLRFPDECVRHKMLDMVGDLALAGCDLVGQFVAHRSGHRLNASLVQALLSRFPVTQQWRASA